MDDIEFNQWVDPNAGRVVYAAQERYRAELRRSLLAFAHKHVLASRAAGPDPTCADAKHMSAIKQARGAKSVAAQQRDGFARELACVQAENQKLMDKVDDLQAALRDNRLHAKTTLQAQSERERDENAKIAERRLAELAGLLDDKQAELADANMQVEHLRHDCTNLSNELALEKASSAAAQENIAAIEAELAKLEQELHSARRDRDEKNLGMSTLHAELDKASNELHELQCAASRSEADKVQLSAELAALSAERVDLEAKRHALTARVTELERQLQDLQPELSARVDNEKRLEAAVSDYSAQKEQAELTLAQTQAELQSLVNELKQERGVSENLRHSLEVAMNDLDTLRDAQTQLSAEKQAHQDTLARLSVVTNREAELRTAATEAHEAQNASKEELSRLKLQLAESDSTVDRIRAALTSESQKVTLQQKLLAELQGENAELKTKRAVATSTYHQEHARLVAIEKEVVEARVQSRKMQAYQQESERAIQKLNSENRKLYEERLELAQGFEKEVHAREALETKLKSVQFCEQSLLSEIEEQNQKLVAQITAHSQELLEAQDKAAVLEQELSRVLHAQSQRDSDFKGVHRLETELKQMEGWLKQERQRTRRLQNQIQDLKGNIRVVVRVRPSKSDSLNSLRLSSDTIMLSGMQSTCKGSREVAKAYHFDRVFGPDATNQAVCEETEYLVQSALDGHNVCILAYGQTGSGKTWTMGSLDGVSMFALDSVMQTAAKSHEKESIFEYTIKVESVEIYNEQFRDLLDDSPMLTGPVTGLMSGPISRYGRLSMTGNVAAGGNSARDHGGASLKMNERTRLPELTGTRKITITSAEHAHELFAKAARARSVAATAANARSSRSHFVFIVHIERRHKQAANSEVQHGVLNLVDLAGSERLAHSKTTGDRLVETTAINSSLSTLGNVIKTLASREHSRPGDRFDERNNVRPMEYVTYRDSKLTFLLQGSLSGNSKAMLLATLSPEADHANETRSTLQFAETASKATVRR